MVSHHGQKGDVSPELQTRNHACHSFVTAISTLSSSQKVPHTYLNTWVCGIPPQSCAGLQRKTVCATCVPFSGTLAGGLLLLRLNSFALFLHDCLGCLGSMLARSQRSATMNPPGVAGYAGGSVNAHAWHEG